MLGWDRETVPCCTLSADYTFQYTDGTAGTGTRTGQVVEYEYASSPTTDCNALVGASTCYYRFAAPYNETELLPRYDDIAAGMFYVESCFYIFTVATIILGGLLAVGVIFILIITWGYALGLLPRSYYDHIKYLFHDCFGAQANSNSNPIPNPSTTASAHRLTRTLALTLTLTLTLTLPRLLRRTG